MKGAFIFLENIHVYKMFGRIFNRKCATREEFTQETRTGKEKRNDSIRIRYDSYYTHPAQLFIAGRSKT